MSDVTPEETARCNEAGHKPEPFAHDPESEWCTCACGKRIYFKDITFLEKASKQDEIVCPNKLNTP
jgi:hypothetical protein